MRLRSIPTSRKDGNANFSNQIDPGISYEKSAHYLLKRKRKKLRVRRSPQRWFTKLLSIISLIFVAYLVLPSRNPYSIPPLRLHLQKLGVLDTPALNSPRILIAEGCVGSHGVASVIAEIMNEHGMNVDLNLFGGEIELTEPEKNPFRSSAEQLLRKEERFVSVFGPRNDEIMAEAFIQMNEYASYRNKTLFFKANTHHLDDTQKILIEGLESINATFASVVRENILDRAICIVKDCLNTEVGYPVENGVQTDLCFSRRDKKGAKVKAYVSDIPKFMQFLDKMYWDGVRDVDMVDKLISPAETQSFEQLFAFEYTDDELTFHKSQSAWTSMLLSMLPNMDEEIIERVLRSHQNTRSSPQPHSELIENYDELMAVLDSDVMKAYKAYIRQ